jgi:hypothetical protein
MTTADLFGIEKVFPVPCIWGPGNYSEGVLSLTVLPALRIRA